VYAVIDVDGNTAPAFKVITGERLRHSFAAAISRETSALCSTGGRCFSAGCGGEGTTQVNVEQYRQNGQLALESPED
jgi:hypothetical protein